MSNCADIIVTGHCRTPLWVEGAIHAFLQGRTGNGNTDGGAIPTLLHMQSSIVLSLGTSRHSSERVARWLEEGDGKSYEDGLRHHSLVLLVSELYQLWMGY